MSTGEWGLRVASSRGPGSFAYATMRLRVWATENASLAAGDRMLMLLLRIHSLLFLMPFYPLVSAVAMLGLRGCWEVWSLGKGISFLWAPREL